MQIGQPDCNSNNIMINVEQDDPNYIPLENDDDPFDMMGQMLETPRHDCASQQWKGTRKRVDADQPAFLMQKEKYVWQWVEFWRRMQGEENRNKNEK